MIITSKTNEKVKFVKSLNDKKARKENNAYYLEGYKVISEILNDEEKAVNILFIAYSSELLRDDIEKVKNKCQKYDIEVTEFSKDVFSYMCDTVTPQGILCVLKYKEKSLEECIKNTTKNIFVLDFVQDLGNLGTIVRNCAAFDIENIVCINNTADVFSPKALRSTMGCINKVNIFYNNTENVFKILKENNFCVIGTDLKETTSLEKIDFSKKIAFVFGNESKGVSRETLEKCDEKIKISMTNNAESLNVSVASGIIGYYQYVNKK